MKGFYIHEKFRADLHPTLNLKRKIRPMKAHKKAEV
jgi:hypothetical protein